MREVVLDTETTGLDPLRGDRIVEIGCVELFNHVSTNNSFHAYLNPERAVPTEAAMVHGLTDEFLADKPVFAQKVDEFLTFISDSTLIIHNAQFDMGFINAELTRCGYKRLPMERSTDTVAMARKMFPGAPASLDALCKRFCIDASKRTLHGALLDAQLLAEVYLELRGGRQPDLQIVTAEEVILEKLQSQVRTHRDPRPHEVPPDELAAHEMFIQKLKKPLWKRA